MSRLREDTLFEGSANFPYGSNLPYCRVRFMVERTTEEVGLFPLTWCDTEESVSITGKAMTKSALFRDRSLVGMWPAVLLRRSGGEIAGTLHVEYHRIGSPVLYEARFVASFPDHPHHPRI